MIGLWFWELDEFPDFMAVGFGVVDEVWVTRTSGEPGDNHRMQLHGYAMLVESAYPEVTVSRAFLYRIPDDRVFVIPIEEEWRERVREAVVGIGEMVREQALPEATEVRGRCEDCEFANYCGDVW